MDWKGKSPVSEEFDDIYYDPEHGLEEVDFVFVAHNQLLHRFSLHSVFTIGELGFGTGLNILRAIQLFLEHAPAEAVLHVVSCEKFPLSREDMKKALANWPSLEKEANELLRVYPDTPFGFRRLWMFGGRVRLTLLFGDAFEMLQEFSGTVDAWFFDGFAPQRNPDMWSQELFDIISQRSHSETTFATFAAAGFVRRNMQAAGFEVIRSKGFGRKREMLHGRVCGSNKAVNSVPKLKVGVIGGGIAGCAAAYVFGNYGCDVTMFDKEQLHAGASGNSLGMAKNFATRFPTPLEHWNSAAFSLLNSVVHNSAPFSHVVAFTGIMHEASHARTQKKIRMLTNHHSGVKPSIIDSEAGVYEHCALILKPVELCRTLFKHSRATLRLEEVVGFSNPSEKCEIRTHNLREECDVVLVCNGHDSVSLLQLQQETGLSRGQLATAHSSLDGNTAHSFGHYALRFNGQIVIGSTYDREKFDTHLHSQDHKKLVDEAYEHVPDLMRASEWEEAATKVNGRTSLRIATPHQLPIVGALDGWNDTLYADTAFGSRGLSGALLAAEVLACSIFGVAAPISNSVIEKLKPL